MFFDLTPEVKLEKKSEDVYLVLRILLYLTALLIGLFLIFRLLFPIGFFTFSFLNPNSSKNTVADPRDLENVSLDKGKIAEGKKMVFDASLVGDFSEASIVFDLKKNSPGPDPENQIEVYKSFRAFLFPEDSPAGFPDGSWLHSGDKYYFVSSGKLRPFGSRDVLSKLGFSEEYFVQVSEEELANNPSGEEISDDYPDGTVFSVDDDYYLFSSGKLLPFVSREAFLSRNKPNQAISKNGGFLEGFQMAEEPVGFAEGSLIAYGDSAYVVSGKEILPIGDPLIFEAAGFSWGDLINVSGEDISIYEKGKMFSMSSVHPDGTVFFDRASGKFYLIKEGRKHLLPSESAASFWSHRHPIEADSAGLFPIGGCSLVRKAFDLGRPTYSCQIAIVGSADLPGKDYEFVFVPGSEVEADSLDVTFKRTLSIENLKRSVAEIISRIKRNYVE